MWAPFLTHSIPLTHQQTGQAQAKSHGVCVCVRREGDESICVSTNMNMFSWRLSLYRCVLCLSVCSRESMRHICVFLSMCKCVHVCVYVCVCLRLSVCAHV